uniref:Uncharacterized protein n=1 Tax=Panagrolaimus sp. JU765 TaxID=591449 RepID=A0AC34RQ24_9BILA
MSHVENCNCIAKKYEFPSNIIPDYNLAFWIIRGDNVCKWTTRPRTVPKLKTERSKYRKITVDFLDLLLRERLANEDYSFPTTNSPMNDTVFFITDYVKYHFDVDWIIAQRFIEFEHWRITGHNYCLLEDLQPIMTENVTEAIFKCHEIILKKIETFLPNLKYLSCRKKVVKDWPKALIFEKIKTLEIHTEKVDDWKALATFIKRQKSGFKMIIEGHRSSDFKFNKENLLDYFKLCDPNLPEHCLTLFSWSNKDYCLK